MRHPLHAFTRADLAEMPDDGRRYEIIGGEVVVSPSSTVNHQRVVGVLMVRLGVHLRLYPLGEVLMAPLDVVLSPYNVVQPDLLYIARSHPHWR